LFLSDEVIKIGMGPTQDIKRLAWSYCWLPSFRRIDAVVDVSSLAKKAHPG
jgi:hypothetical protein